MVFLGPVGDIDVVQRHLPGLQYQVLGARLVIFVLLKFLFQGHVRAVILPVIHQPVLFVRSGDIAKTAVFFGRGVDGDPDRAGRQRADWPVLPILMPRGLFAV